MEIEIPEEKASGEARQSWPLPVVLLMETNSQSCDGDQKRPQAVPSMTPPRLLLLSPNFLTL